MEPTAPQPVILPVHGQSPRFGDNNWLAPNCTVVGDVVTGKDCSIWFGAIVRGTCVHHRLGEGQHQDGAVLHGTYRQTDCTIGDGASIGHNAIVHGCTVEAGALIGMGAVVMDRAVVGRGAVVAAGAVVLRERRLAKGSCGPGCLPSASRTWTQRCNGTSPTRQSATGNMPAGMKGRRTPIEPYPGLSAGRWDVSPKGGRTNVMPDPKNRRRIGKEGVRSLTENWCWGTSEDAESKPFSSERLPTASATIAGPSTSSTPSPNTFSKAGKANG